MSSLTDFLHRLVDKAGISELHSEIDDLAKDEGKTAVEDVATDVENTAEGKEDSPNAAE